MIHFESRIYCLLLLFLVFGVHAQAQKYSSGQLEGTPKYLKFADDQKPSVQEATDILHQELQLSTNDELRLQKEDVDDLGFSHQKFQQYYQGIKVENGLYTIHSKNGKVSMMNGQYLKVKKLNTTPALSKASALSQALNHVGASEYMWQSNDNERFAQQTEASRTFKPQGELVIVENAYAADKALRHKPVLAWKFNIYAQKPLSRDYVYVDAETGRIAYVEPIIKHCFDRTEESCAHDHDHSPETADNNRNLLENMLAAGTAATRYSGSQTIETSTTTGGYRLRETTRGNGINTYDCNTGTSYGNAVDFVDNDNDWTAGEWDNAQKDNAALDAHWGSQVTYDYWISTHNRNSWNGSGAAINSYVHFDANYNNAFWNGSVMTYGDGSGAGGFDALTSLDVAAHEIGHAVCETTANLAYQRESGALNEGFSDIWGASVEFFGAPTKSTWLIGEDIEMRSGHAALRSMSDPNSEGQPDTYGGTNWINPNCGTPTRANDYCGVHTNSGVLNYWFYLLTSGGTGTNDNGDAFTITGIGIVNAAKIAYRLESVYLGANSTFADARSFGIQAAEDLYTAGSAEVIATTNAFYAVGVGAEYGGAPSYCASQGNSIADEWIGNVEIGTFSNPSDAQNYSDFTGTTISVNAGATYATTLTPTYSGTAYSEHWRVWIDYNGDSDFDDAGEEVFSAGGSTTAVTGNIIIDAAAAGVTTRMRVSMKYNAAPTSCETFAYGEVEDYTISIGGGATCDTPTGLAVASITSSAASASWSAVSGAASYDVRFRQTGTTTWTTGNVTGTGANMTGLTASTDYEVQVRANCTGASSAYTASTNFTTSAPPSGGCSGGITAFPYNEGFESGLGAWTQGAGDDFDWTRNSGGTTSSNTGPSAASEGTFYLYTESSTPNYSTKVAILNSPCFDLSAESSAVFDFAYHLYGASNMGGMTLDASSDNGQSWTTIWSASGNQGNAWLTASVDLMSYVGAAVQLRFVGTTGTTWQGDMAIDNIQLSDGTAPSCVDISLTLTFDNYPEETSWTLTNAGGTVESGGTYGTQADGSTLVVNMCVAPGCYDFNMLDSYGDGMCCSYGNGSYSLAGANGTILASGASYTNSETTNVCPNASTIFAGNDQPKNTQQPASAQHQPEFGRTQLSIFPNPVVEQINVHYDSELAGKGTARILDVFGKLIQTETWTVAKGINNYQLNLGELPQGTYFLEVANGETTMVKRFIIAR